MTGAMTPNKSERSSSDRPEEGSGRPGDAAGFDWRAAEQEVGDVAPPMFVVRAPSVRLAVAA